MEMWMSRARKGRAGQGVCSQIRRTRMEGSVDEMKKGLQAEYVTR